MVQQQERKTDRGKMIYRRYIESGEITIYPTSCFRI